jgi:hypothetical protein
VDEFGVYRGFDLTVRQVHPGWWNGWAILDRPSRAGGKAVSRTGFFAEDVSAVLVDSVLRQRIDEWHSIPR